MSTAGRKPFNAELLDSPPPANLEAERAVLGSMLLQPAVIDDVAPVVSAADFHGDGHGKLYGHLIAMKNGGGGAVDATLLVERLKQAGDLEACGGTGHIGEIAQSVPVVSNAVYYAKIVRDKATQRGLIYTGQEMLRDGYSPHVTPDSLVERAQRNLERVASGTGEEVFNLRTAEELMAEQFDETFCIDRLFIQGEPLTIGGPSKSMKTSLLIAAGVALATGTPFLGDPRFAVSRAMRVGVLSAESGGRTLRRLLQRVRDSAELSEGALTGLLIDEKMPQMDDPEHEAGLRRAILDFEIEILGFDPLYLGDDEDSQSNLAGRGQRLRRLAKLCLDMGVTPILCCHTKKSTFAKREPLTLDDLHGAGIGEFSRQWWLVNRRSEYQHDGQHDLHFSAGGSYGHGGLFGLDIFESTYESPGGRVWQPTVLDPDEVKQGAKDRKSQSKEAERQERLDGDRMAIVVVMRRCPQGETKTALRDSAGMSGSRFNTALASLIGDGIVETANVLKGNKRTPLDGYALTREGQTL